MRTQFPLRWQASIIAVLLFANVSVYRAVFAAPTLTITVATAGKGSMAVIRAPGGETILVDTGPDASALRALGTALPPWQRHLSAIILTGGKAAQTGGLGIVQSRYSVGSITRFGSAATPYGSSLAFGPAILATLAPGQTTLLYRSVAFIISSSTPPGTYSL